MLILQGLVCLSSEPCDFGGPDEAQVPRPRAGRSAPSPAHRSDRHAPRAGPAGGADRLGVLRDGVGGVLPIAYGEAGDVPAAGRRAALPPAGPRALGWGGGGAVGGEPLLAALL